MQKLSSLLLSFAFIAFLASCGGGTDTETVNATDPETATPTEASPEEDGKAMEGTAYSVQTGESVLDWTGSKKIVDSKHHGNIKLKDGQLYVDNGTLTGGMVTIDMTTIVNEDLEDPEKNAQLVGHLSSEDFFYVEKYPTAKFEITEVKPVDEEGASHHITGNLTLKDVTKSITVPATVTMEDSQLRATAEFGIDRSQWNVKYGSDTFFDNLGDKAISNEIKLELTLVAEQGAAA